MPHGSHATVAKDWARALLCRRAAATSAAAGFSCSARACGRMLVGVWDVTLTSTLAAPARLSTAGGAAATAGATGSCRTRRRWRGERAAALQGRGHACSQAARRGLGVSPPAPSRPSCWTRPPPASARWTWAGACCRRWPGPTWAAPTPAPTVRAGLAAGGGRPLCAGRTVRPLTPPPAALLPPCRLSLLPGLQPGASCCPPSPSRSCAGTSSWGCAGRPRGWGSRPWRAGPAPAALLATQHPLLPRTPSHPSPRRRC